MKTISSLAGVVVVVSLLSSSFARGDTHVIHVSTMKNYCSGQGYCARMSNGSRTTMMPAFTTDPVRFNPVDGQPIR
jgi:hypothetical protein